MNSIYHNNSQRYWPWGIVIILLCAGVSPLYAQVNVELYRKSEGVQGNIGLHFGGSKGNSDFFAGGGAANITYNTKAYSLLILGDGLLGFRGGKSFSNEGLVHLRYTRTKPKRFQPEGFLQTDYARPRKLTFRALAGGGFRTILFEDAKYSLTIGNSLMWEREHLDIPATDPHLDRTSILRSSNYINLRIRAKATITLTGYYQVMPSEPADVRMLGNLQIASPVAGPLQQVTTIRYRHDSRPPVGIEQNDIKIGTSFAFTFGKKERIDE